MSRDSFLLWALHGGTQHDQEIVEWSLPEADISYVIEWCRLAHVNGSCLFRPSCTERQIFDGLLRESRDSDWRLFRQVWHAMQLVSLRSWLLPHTEDFERAVAFLRQNQRMGYCDCCVVGFTLPHSYGSFKTTRDEVDAAQFEATIKSMTHKDSLLTPEEAEDILIYGPVISQTQCAEVHMTKKHRNQRTFGDFRIQ